MKLVIIFILTLSLLFLSIAELCFISQGGGPANNYYFYKYLPQSVFTSFRIINSKTHGTNKEICQLWSFIQVLSGPRLGWIPLLFLARLIAWLLVGTLLRLLTLVIQLIFIFYFLTSQSQACSQTFLQFTRSETQFLSSVNVILSSSGRNISDFSSRYFLAVAPAGDMIYEVSPGIVKILQYHHNQPHQPAPQKNWNFIENISCQPLRIHYSCIMGLSGSDYYYYCNIW